MTRWIRSSVTLIYDEWKIDVPADDMNKLTSVDAIADYIEGFCNPYDEERDGINIGECGAFFFAEEKLREALSGIIGGADMVFSAANGTRFDEVEEKALAGSEVFRPKILFGETLGSSYMLAVCLAAAAIKSGSFRGKPCSSVAVTGFDMAGNYMAVRLKKPE